MVAPRADTEIGAANDALQHCKQPPIADFAEGNNRARTVAAHFAAVRDALLAENEWGFATGWDTPAEAAPESLGPLKKRYPLPDDCIQVRFVDGLKAAEWGMEASAGGSEVKVLVTNATAPLVCYTRRIENPKLWDPLFLKVFGLRLGAKIAPTLAKSQQLALQLEAAADDELAPATLADAREKAPGQVPRETSWIAARR